MKYNLKKVSFAQDAKRILDGGKQSVTGLYSITVLDWLRAAEINFSSTTALTLAALEGLPINKHGSSPCEDVSGCEDES